MAKQQGTLTKFSVDFSYTITWFEMGDTVTTAGMHFDTFSLYSSTLRADISAPVNPRGLKLTLLESEDSSDSSKIQFSPLVLKGWEIEIGREKKISVLVWWCGDGVPHSKSGNCITWPKVAQKNRQNMYRSFGNIYFYLLQYFQTPCILSDVILNVHQFES